MFDVRCSTSRFPAVAIAALALSWLMTAGGLAQLRPPVHYLYRSDLPPGTVAQSQLRRGGPLQGYFQPIELYCPEGGSIALEVEGQFTESQPSRVLAGMLIGPVYRAKVTEIPEHPGEEVYPTVEVINRLYPPPGHEARFPVPIHITQEELELALSGHFVTRVVYLESPATALPVRQDPKFQRYFEVHPQKDPLLVADELGRPMAILRMGSRVPDASGQMGMNYGSPPLVRYELPKEPPQTPPEPGANPAQPTAPVPGAPPPAITPPAPSTKTVRRGRFDSAQPGALHGASSVLTSSRQDGAELQPARPRPAASRGAMGFPLNTLRRRDEPRASE